MTRRNFLRLSAWFAGSIALPDLFTAVASAGGQPVPNSTIDVVTDIEKYIAHLRHPGVAPDSATAALFNTDPPSELDVFLDRADEVFRAAPSVDCLCFNNTTGWVLGWRLDAERLAACPHLALILTLGFIFCQLGPEGVRTLAASAYFKGINRLAIGVDRIGDEGSSRPGCVTVPDQLDRVVAGWQSHRPGRAWRPDRITSPGATAAARLHMQPHWR